jgi:hypothetical protein
VHKTPWEIVHERELRVDPAVYSPLVYLNELVMKKLDAKLLWGYELIRRAAGAYLFGVAA